jgi:hypothetical protein
MAQRYTYQGDRLTAPALKNQSCRAVLNDRGKCIRGRNSNMLVEFETQGRHVVLARLLRKI